MKTREILKKEKKKSNTITNNIFLPFIWPFIGKFSAYFCPFQQVLKNRKNNNFFSGIFWPFLAFLLSFFMHSASIYCPFFKLIFISQFSRLVFSFISPFFSLFVCIQHFFFYFFILILSIFNIKQSYVEAFFGCIQQLLFKYFGPFYASVWFFL